MKACLQQHILGVLQREVYHLQLVDGLLQHEVGLLQYVVGDPLSNLYSVMVITHQLEMAQLTSSDINCNDRCPDEVL